MRRLAPLLVLLPLAAAMAGACGNDKLRRAGEQVQAVSGNPAVGQGLPGVDRLDGGADAGVFGSAAPFQVDSFEQQQVSKVDILWVIDNSFSMQAKQDRVKANFVSFTKFLTEQHIDYHLGVVTSDVYDPKQSGRLVNFAGLPRPWIDADAGDPQVAFIQNASVGTGGSGDERPLMAGMLALTAPLSPATPDSPDAGAANCANKSGGGFECFLRPDAPLYTIIVSDEEDTSCAPVNNQQEGCDNAAANLTGYGSIEYWSRFYAGVKGAGGTSRVAAIVANENTAHDCATVFAHVCDARQVATQCTGAVPNCNLGQNSTNPCCQALRLCHNDLAEKAQYCTLTNVLQTFPDGGIGGGVAPYFRIGGSFNGCVATDPFDGGVDFTAWSATRSAAVATNTGGVATSICESNYTPALARLGLQAAGLRSDFPLSRAPIPSSLVVQVAGVTVPHGPAAWEFVGCEVPPPAGPLPHPPANVIRFASPPPAGAKVTASYNVNVRGLGACP